MVVKIPAFEMLENGNRYTESSPAPDLSAIVFQPLGLAARNWRATSGQGTAHLLSTALRVCHKYLNLK
jgi:hypothetical protein